VTLDNPSIIAIGLALIALCLSGIALIVIGKARREIGSIHNWLREAEASGTQAEAQLTKLERESNSLGGLVPTVQELQSRLSALESKSSVVRATPTPAAAPRPEMPTGILGSWDRPSEPIPSVFTPLPQPPPPPPPPRDPYAYQLDNLRLDFNAAAQEPSHDKLDKFAAKHRLGEEPGNLWRMSLPDGRVAILPGRVMLVGWARQYRGETGKSLRDDQLAKWYDMTNDEVLSLERVALQQPGGVVERGTLRGV
jgi:hypothetical protein